MTYTEGGSTRDGTLVVDVADSESNAAMLSSSTDWTAEMEGGTAGVRSRLAAGSDGTSGITHPAQSSLVTELTSSLLWLCATLATIRRSSTSMSDDASSDASPPSCSSGRPPRQSIVVMPVVGIQPRSAPPPDPSSAKPIDITSRRLSSRNSDSALSSAVAAR